MKTPHPFTSGALLLVIAVGASSVAAQETRPLTVDDQFAIRRVGNPRISPDGRWVAYTVTTTSLEDEDSVTRIWMVDADPAAADARPLPMTMEGTSASSPEWSPDGRWLSFTASRNEEKTQVWVLDRRGGEAQPLTDVKQGVSGYRWSPDGKHLVLTIRDPEPEDSAKAEKDDAPKDPWVVDRLQFKRDGTGYLTGNRHTHLYVFDVETRTLQQLTGGEHDEGSPAWSPDGRWIAFSSNRTEDPDTNENSDLWIVASDLNEPTAEFRQLTTNPGSDSSPAWSPDGRSLTYVTGVEPEIIWYATSHLAVVGADGTNPRILTRELDRNVGSPRFSRDGRSILFELEDSGEDHLASIDLASGQITRPVSGPLALGAYDLGPGGEIVALVGHLDAPAEVFRMTSAGLRRLTHVNDSLMASLKLGEVKDETFKSADGTEIEGFFTLPADYEPGRRYPTLLRIHGGPVSQFSHEFNFEAQLFAANGYAVVTVNPRGSSGYGQDFSYAIWADWGHKDYEDVMAGVDHAIERGWADPDRLGVGGWSYGGILTDHVITQTGRFKGAISGASEVLYIANYGHDHYQRQWEAELGLPWEGNNREVWERISAFNKVEKITTPTLVMGGESDWNVPIQNGEQLYQALRRRGVPTQLVVYPGQPHGLRVPSYNKDRLERYLAWYGKWVKGESQPVATQGGHR